MRNLYIGLLSALAITAVCGSGVAVADAAQKIDPQSIPMLLIQYAFHAGYSTGNSAADAKAKKNPLEDLNATLEGSLSGLNADIPLDLSFAREAYVIQAGFVGNDYSGEKGLGVLYVTASNKDQNAIAIISSARPERTTIFSVDSMLHSELIYDSIAKNKFANNGNCDPLGQVADVKVLKAGSLKITETSAHWSAQNERLFLLDLTGKSPQLVCQP